MNAAQQLAQLLDGVIRGQEFDDPAIQQAACASGLVIVYGASDDLMEFRGAITDEGDVYDGGTVLVDGEGLLPSRDQIDCDDELEKYFERRKSVREITAVWHGQGDYRWTYETSIPHYTFNVCSKNGDLYCRGIVFALSDLDLGKTA